MSLFNMVMGRNLFAVDLLAVLGLNKDEESVAALGHVRDVYTNPEGDRIFILHRNYGESCAKYDEYVGRQTHFVKKASCADETYATYEFTVPEEAAGFVKSVAKVSDPIPPFERYQKFLASAASGAATPSGPMEDVLQAAKAVIQVAMQEVGLKFSGVPKDVEIIVYNRRSGEAASQIVPTPPSE